MKKNKKLKQIADSNLKSFRKNDILDELVEIQQEQQQNNFAEAKKSHVWKRAALSLSAIASIVVVVLLCVFLIPLNENKNPTYLAENELINKSSVAELNEFLGDFLIKDTYLTNVVLVTDKLSGDKLYFRVDFEDSNCLESASLLFIVNKYYQKTERQTQKELQYKNIDIEYNEKIEQQEEVYVFNKYAFFKINDVRVFVENYNKLSLEPEDDFTDFLDKIFV